MSWLRIETPDDVMCGRVRQVAAPVGGRAARLFVIFARRRGRSLLSSVTLL